MSNKIIIDFAQGDLVWSALPLLLFAMSTLCAGALTLLLPETKGQPLAQTTDEAAALGEAREIEPLDGNATVVQHRELTIVENKSAV